MDEILKADFNYYKTTTIILQSKEHLHESIPVETANVCLALQISPPHLLPDTGHMNKKA